MAATTCDANVPLNAPSAPPAPTTDATARRGNMSELSVYRFDDHPWCAAAAREISATAVHRSVVRAANTIGVTASAQTSMASLRARFTVRPLRIRLDDSQPPAMLPASADRKMTTSGGPTVVRSRP